MGRRLTREERATRLAAVANGKARGMTMTAIAQGLGIKVELLRQWIKNQETPRHLRAPERPVLQRRACLRCEKPFDSEGPGNRLCGGCRSHAPVMDSPYTPDPGGSRGRQVGAARS